MNAMRPTTIIPEIMRYCGLQRGIPPPATRNTTSNTKNPYCVVHRLQEYITLSRDLYGAQEDDLLFEMPKIHKFPTLSCEALTYVIREICGALGLPKDQASAHSLRYGGAYMLAMMGLPEYIIAWYGGWAEGSTAMRTYVQISPEVISKVSRHMSMCAGQRSVQDMVRHLLANRVPTELQTGQTPGLGKRKRRA